MYKQKKIECRDLTRMIVIKNDVVCELESQMEEMAIHKPDGSILKQEEVDEILKENEKFKMMEDEYFNLQDKYFKEKSKCKVVAAEIEDLGLENEQLQAQINSLNLAMEKLEEENRELKGEVSELRLMRAQEPSTAM